MTAKTDESREALEALHLEQLAELARQIDRYWNGEAKGDARKVGFCVLVYPFNDGSGRCHYISNGASRRDMASLFREMAAKFEGSPDQHGHG